MTTLPQTGVQACLHDEGAILYKVGSGGKLHKYRRGRTYTNYLDMGQRQVVMESLDGGTHEYPEEKHLAHYSTTALAAVRRYLAILEKDYEYYRQQLKLLDEARSVAKLKLEELVDQEVYGRQSQASYSDAPEVS